MTMKNKSIKQLKCQQLQQYISSRVVKLEALPVDNGWAALIVFLLGDPHLLEGGEGSQDGASDPDGVLPLRGSNDLDLNGGWSKGGDFLLHTVSNTRVHGGASRHDGVGVQVLPDVNIALHDGGGGSSGGHLLFEVKSDIAELLLDVTDNLTLSGGGERVTTLSEDLHEVVGELTASQVQTKDGVGKSITLIDGDIVGDTITRVHDHTGGTTRSVEGKDSLDGNIHSGHVEGLEHDLSHLFTVSLGVEGSLSEEDRLFLRGNTEFIVESVMPDLLHIIPVGDNTVFNG